MLRVTPGTYEADGLEAPPSKSYTHRALVLAGLASESTVRNPLDAEDPHATRRGVEALGAPVEADDGALAIRGGPPEPPDDVLDCANSGTTIRLLSAAASLADGGAVLTGDESLRTRPMGPLLGALEDLGAEAWSTTGDGTPPVVVRGPLEGGTTDLPSDVSSQFLTALLLAAPRTPEGVDVTVETPIRSRPYVEMTLAVLDAFDVDHDADLDAGTVRVPGDQPLPGTAYRVPGDWSSAAFPLALAAATGGRATIEGLPLDDPQGDRAILDHLEAFGADVARGDGAVTVAGPETLEPVTADLGDTPDLFPVLAALAAGAQGTTELAGAEHLRHKESDRIAAMVEALDALGVEAKPRPGGAAIRGGPVQGGTVESRDDHRIAMAGVVLGAAAEAPVTVRESASYKVSYPSFPDHVRAGGLALEVDD